MSEPQVDTGSVLWMSFLQLFDSSDRVWTAKIEWIIASFLLRSPFLESPATEIRISDNND